MAVLPYLTIISAARDVQDVRLAKGSGCWCKRVDHRQVEAACFSCSPGGCSCSKSLVRSDNFNVADNTCQPSSVTLAYLLDGSDQKYNAAEAGAEICICEGWPPGTVKGNARPLWRILDSAKNGLSTVSRSIFLEWLPRPVRHTVVQSKTILTLPYYKVKNTVVQSKRIPYYKVKNTVVQSKIALTLPQYKVKAICDLPAKRRFSYTIGHASVVLVFVVKFVVNGGETHLVGAKSRG